MHAAYVGVTGITSLADVAMLHGAASRAGLHRTATAAAAHRRLMAGVLVSAKTLAGEAVPNRRYPRREAVAELVATLAGFAFTTIHYNSRDPRPLDEQLAALLALAPATDGIQLNLVCPDRAALARFRAQHPAVELILQVNGSALRALYQRHQASDAAPPWAQLGPDAAASPTSIASVYAADEYVRTYAGVVDHALLDLSAGTGKPIDPSWAGVVAADYGPRWRALGITLGLAGGLGPEVEPVLTQIGQSAVLTQRAAARAGERPAPITEMLAHVSLDAESGVRVPVADPLPGARYQDHLEATRLERYLAQSVQRLLAWQNVTPRRPDDLVIALLACLRCDGVSEFALGHGHAAFRAACTRLQDEAASCPDVAALAAECHVDPVHGTVRAWEEGCFAAQAAGLAAVPAPRFATLRLTMTPRAAAAVLEPWSLAEQHALRHAADVLARHLRTGSSPGATPA